MILYIVRHGIAMDKTDPKAPPDPERPLTAKGIQKTRVAALGLKELGVGPDILITSPYVRAAQTAEIFAEALGFPTAKVRVSDSLKPPANPADFIKELSRVKSKDVMCFGHGPHVDRLIAQMVGARAPFTELKKAGIACLERAAAQGAWRLLSILTPKVLRQLA